MQFTIRCDGQAGGEFFYLRIEENGNISLGKSLGKGTSFIISNNGGYYTIFCQEIGLYLGWDLSKQEPKAYSTPIAETRWLGSFSPGQVTTVRAFTSLKKMYLDGLTLNGGVQIVDSLKGQYTGTRWNPEYDLASFKME